MAALPSDDGFPSTPVHTYTTLLQVSHLAFVVGKESYGGNLWGQYRGARKLEYDPPLIEKPKTEDKPAYITLHPYSDLLESTVVESMPRVRLDLRMGHEVPS